MRVIIFILMVQIFPILTFGQSSDPAFTTPLVKKYINRCIDGLESVEYLKNNSITKEMDFCNLATCFSFLESYDKDSLFNEAIYERLRQIAQEFYNEGTPILIIGNGMNSAELSQRLNKEENGYGVTYVSLGNSCLSFGSLDKGITKFNLETKLLVN